jgi:hypothetical protein
MAMITIWNLGWRQEALLRSYYRNSSPGRFWLYLKQLKRGCMGLPNATRDFVDFSLDPIWQNGPEDILVKGE